MNKERLLTMLGFAMRAGMLCIGTDQVIALMPRRGALRLVVVTEDSSEATRSRVILKAGYYGINAHIIAITKDELGSAIGKDYSPACVGIKDEGFAEQIIRAINP